MASDKQPQSLSDVWIERYDDRDDEALACQVWAEQLAARERAMANPIKAFDRPDEVAAGRDRPMAADDSKPA